MGETNGKRKYTTISIPTPLYESIERFIDGTDFRSVTEFMVYVTRESLSGNQAPAQEGTRALGYLR